MVNFAKFRKNDQKDKKVAENHSEVEIPKIESFEN